MFLHNLLRFSSLLLPLAFLSCETAEAPTPEPKGPAFEVLDTDFSKGRLGHTQHIGLGDLEKFHGHLCDGLVVGALAFEQAAGALYPDGPIDRTNLRVASQASPCLTDVAVYLSGGRYPFGSFYVDTAITAIYIVQRIDDGRAVRVALKAGIKPSAIDSLGAIAVAGKLSPCGIDSLRQMEDDFTTFMLSSNASALFVVSEIMDYKWRPYGKNDFVKTDVLNKDLPECGYSR